VNEKKPKRSRDIGDRPRPVAPVSTLYMFTDKQTGESGLVWGTRRVAALSGFGQSPLPHKGKVDRPCNSSDYAGSTSSDDGGRL